MPINMLGLQIENHPKEYYINLNINTCYPTATTLPVLEKLGNLLEESCLPKKILSDICGHLRGR